MELFKEPSVIVFILGQAIALIGSIIAWIVSVIRLRDKVNQMEKNCEVCRESINKKIQEQESEFNSDIAEIKSDVKDLRKDFQEFKICISNNIAEIKTLLSGKTIQL